MRICSRVSTAVVLLLLSVSSEAVWGMQFKPTNLNDNQVVLTGVGPIIPGDLARLQEVVADAERGPSHVVALVLDSPGGQIAEGAKLSEFISKRRLGVAVAADNQCVSACFLLFAAAPFRLAAPNALIGVHNARAMDGSDTAGSQNATIQMIRLLRDYGVPAVILGKIAQTEPNRVEWLTPADLALMNVTVIADTTPTIKEAPKDREVTPAKEDPAPQKEEPTPTPIVSPPPSQIGPPPLAPDTAESDARLRDFTTAAVNTTSEAAFTAYSKLTAIDRNRIPASSDPILKERFCRVDYELTARLQAGLRYCGYESVAVDGAWGPRSKQAARVFAELYRSWYPQKAIEVDQPSKTLLDALVDVKGWWFGPCAGVYQATVVNLPDRTPIWCSPK